MSEPVLVVLAAGMGSRYGGTKQIDEIDKNGHILVDYSVYDAIIAGFRRVVFIIRKEMEGDFSALIKKRIWRSSIDVDFAFQDSINRKKPWGTGHAIACLDGKVTSSFAVINADDFYGRDAFLKIYSFLKSNDDTETCAMVSYRLENTLSKHGAVSRGICQTDGGYLKAISETSGIIEYNGIIFSLSGDVFSPEARASMNFWGFSAEIIEECKRRFDIFLNEKGRTDEKSEFYLPMVVSELIKEGKIRVKNYETNGKWYGITYKNDKSEVSLALEKMVDKGIYPINL